MSFFISPAAAFSDMLGLTLISAGMKFPMHNLLVGVIINTMALLVSPSIIIRKRGGCLDLIGYVWQTRSLSWDNHGQGHPHRLGGSHAPQRSAQYQRRIPFQKHPSK
jgi:hypothetical protein